MNVTSRFFIFCTLLCSFSLEAKLLDKIVAIVNDNVITLSQVNRISTSVAIKKNVAPMIYENSSYTNQEVLNITINKFLIRAKLSELGYLITDDQVEARIKANQERLGVDRKALVGFLKQQGTSFEEYFETFREAIEYSYFVNRVISPMISISEQDIKNTFYKNNSKDARMNFKYNLIDYSIDKDSIAKPNKGVMEEVVKQYRQTNNLPEEYSTLQANNLDDITESGITSELNQLLKSTDEGAFTTPIMLNNRYHVFYVSKKDLVESENYLAQKEKINDQLFEKAVKAETALWFERERNKHYIKISL